ncbi:hypothetical protein [Cohnella hashimotonis]|uniref:Uncharacterized protein n=1 Tax=Cohnella hashimotonis TaxID=2826895 RepID=A0ABT6TCD6_9BACL|nr:hypothetical protein [Cohnella hashimotonis]MDI4644497.1 hypothetical protein [Cohnella hashimotonis]
MKLTPLFGVFAAGILLFAYFGCKAMLAHGRKGESAGFLLLVAWSVYMSLAKLNDWPRLTLIRLQQFVLSPACDWFLHFIHYR